MEVYNLDESPSVVTATGTRTRAKPQRRKPRLHCAICGHPITSNEHLSLIAGVTRHVFTNPHGIEFCIACFSAAPGCFIAGDPTETDTWFPSYSWSMAHCSECRSQLGWFFQNLDGDTFYGLRVELLEEREADS